MIMETELFGKKPYHFKKKMCSHRKKKSTKKIMKKKKKTKEIKGKKGNKIEHQYSISFKTLYCNLTAI